MEQLNNTGLRHNYEKEEGACFRCELWDTCILWLQKGSAIWVSVASTAEIINLKSLVDKKTRNNVVGLIFSLE